MPIDLSSGFADLEREAHGLEFLIRLDGGDQLVCAADLCACEIPIRVDEPRPVGGPDVRRRPVERVRIPDVPKLAQFAAEERYLVEPRRPKRRVVRETLSSRALGAELREAIDETDELLDVERALGRRLNVHRPAFERKRKVARWDVRSIELELIEAHRQFAPPQTLPTGWGRGPTETLARQRCVAQELA